MMVLRRHRGITFLGIGSEMQAQHLSKDEVVSGYFEDLDGC
jgi:hypothetical protein